MTDETWRPLGVDTDEHVAEYDALHDGIPSWMESAYWAWVRDAITIRRNRYAGSSRTPVWITVVDLPLVEEMCQRLRLALPNMRGSSWHDQRAADTTISNAMFVIQKNPLPLQAADYLLAHEGHAKPEELEALLARAKSAWTVGERAGHPGLVRRVPEGVQTAADGVMQRAGQAGVRLARAWEELYGLEPNPSEAYRLAILAVEDAAVPVVSPTNTRATLGTVLAQIESQGDWSLPMEREHDNAPSREVIVGMARMLWHGQHDRHGGQPSAPGNVSEAEARVAVSLAVALVDWFSAGLVQRQSD